MARSNAYKNQIRNDIDRINYRLKGIEQLLGPDSEQYERYVNSLTATLPAGSYTLSDTTGIIELKASKINLETLTHEQLKYAAALPTVKQSITRQKKELQRFYKGSSKEGVSISDIEALNELNAKTYVRDKEDEKHKLKYNDSVKTDMQAKGKKTYQQLKAILEKGENGGKTEERKAKSRAASKRYYEKHKAEINARRRAKRAEARGRA